jgi:hypothetical protein
MDPIRSFGELLRDSFTTHVRCQQSGVCSHIPARRGAAPLLPIPQFIQGWVHIRAKLLPRSMYTILPTRYRLFVCLIQSGYSRRPYKPSLESNLIYKRDSLPSLINKSDLSL